MTDFTEIQDKVKKIWTWSKDNHTPAMTILTFVLVVVAVVQMFVILAQMNDTEKLVTATKDLVGATNGMIKLISRAYYPKLEADVVLETNFKSARVDTVQRQKVLFFTSDDYNRSDLQFSLFIRITGDKAVEARFQMECICFVYQNINDREVLNESVLIPWDISPPAAPKTTLPRFDITNKVKEALDTLAKSHFEAYGNRFPDGYRMEITISENFLVIPEKTLIPGNINYQIRPLSE
jgi:hypothetical protein